MFHLCGKLLHFFCAGQLTRLSEAIEVTSQCYCVDSCQVFNILHVLHHFFNPPDLSTILKKSYEIVDTDNTAPLSDHSDISIREIPQM